MSLLEKASIVTTPTAYGVGVLNSIKPAIPFGEELVVNGDGSSTVGWGVAYSNTTLSVNNNNLRATANSSGAYGLSQSLSLDTSKKYIITAVINVDNASGGTANLRIAENAPLTTNDTTLANATGTTTTTFTPTASTMYIGIVDTADSSSNYVEINSISVKEKTDADFQFERTSSATRVNPDYLIETVSINSANLVQNGNFSELGSELVTNGDFATDSNWTKGTGWSISNGKAVSNSSTSSIYQATGSNYTSGKTYKIVFTVSDYVSGSVRPEITNVIGSNVSSNGTFTQYIVATSSAIGEELKAVNFVGSIDNVSVKQVDPNDNWTAYQTSTSTTNKELGLIRIDLNSSNSNAGAYQENVFENGKKYKIVINAKGSASFSMSVLESNGAASITSIGTPSLTTEYQDFLFNFTATGSYDIFLHRLSSASSANQSIFIKSVSVIEIQENGVPRLDYTNGTASILLEPQSTNLVTYSEDINSWSKAGSVTISSNNATSPEGVQNASLILPNAGSGTFGVINSISKSASSITYTLSGFAKEKDYNFLILRIDSGAANGVKGAFDLSNGAISTAFSTNGTGFTFIDAYIKPYTNNWYRYEVSFTTDSSTLLRTIFYVSDITGNGFSVPSYTANGTDGVLFWGAQLEQGSYPTSYIPTSGSTVTRAAETLNNAGNSDLINSTEGVLYAEISALADDGTSRAISLSNGTSLNQIVIRYYSTTNSVVAFIRVGGTFYASLSGTLITTSFNKLAFKYKENDFSLFINGSKVATDTSGNTYSPNTLNKLAFNRGDNADDFYGKTKCVAVFKEALSDTELACLTSTNNREIFLNYYYRMQYVGANTEALSCAEQTFNV